VVAHLQLAHVGSRWHDRVDLVEDVVAEGDASAAQEILELLGCAWAQSPVPATLGAVSGGDEIRDQRVLLGRGKDLGVAWELWLNEVLPYPAQSALWLRILPRCGAGGTARLQRGAPLRSDRLTGVAKRDSGVVFVTGPIGHQFKTVQAEFADGTTKDAVLLKKPELPVAFYVLFVERRPTRVLGLHHLGGGEWIEGPVPANMPCGPK
jgi:hypothetical protein